MRLHRRQPTSLCRSWDSPGKNTGVGCRFLLQCMKVKSENEVAQSCPTLRDPTDCSPSGSSVHGIFQARVLEWGAIAFSTECIVLAQYPTILSCCPLLLLPSVFPSITVFSNESARHIRWPKYWSFRFSIRPVNEYSGLISFRTDWFDLQGTLTSLLQHHRSKASVLQCSAFFMVQFSYACYCC